MKLGYYPILVALLSFLLAGGCAFHKQTKVELSCAHDATTFRCVEYLTNYDGDTITVNIRNVHPLIGNNISVRIAGIDSPELRTTNNCEKIIANKSKDFVRERLSHAHQIEIQNIRRDKYFRILGDVSVDGKSLKDELLKRHFAYLYSGGKKEQIDWCRFVE